MFGYCLLNAAMYCCPTFVCGVQPHHVMLPEVAEPTCAGVDDPHAASAVAVRVPAATTVASRSAFRMHSERTIGTLLRAVDRATRRPRCGHSGARSVNRRKNLMQASIDLCNVCIEAPILLRS